MLWVMIRNSLSSLRGAGTGDAALPYCRNCRGVLAPLILVHERGYPHGSNSHQLSYKRAVIYQCRACGFGQVEKLSHDCFNYDEAWDHYLWLVLQPGDARSLEQALSLCPRPTWPGCQCDVHQVLTQSLNALACPSWVGPVIPEFASEQSLAAHTKLGALSFGKDALPSVIAQSD